LYAEVFNTFCAEVNAYVAAAKELVDKIFVDEAFEPANDKTRDFVSCPFPNNALKVNG
jgi:hypothetical protein